MAKRKPPITFTRAALASALLLAVSGTSLALGPLPEDPSHDALKLLGKYVFFDNLSNPPRMACSTCHEPTTGGTANNSVVNLFRVAIRGADPHTRGNIKPPTNAYASVITWKKNDGKWEATLGGIPPFHDETEGCATGASLFPPGTPFPPPQGVVGKQWCGGNFWNGRAEGRPTGDEPLFPPNPTPTADGALFPLGATRHIGREIFKGKTYFEPYSLYFGPTADQALNPMPNPVEQNIERKEVCNRVKGAKYAPLYEKVWHEPINCSDTPAPVQAPDVVAAGETEKEFDISFKRLALAMGAWQSSSDLNPFSSKRDKALAAQAPHDDGKKFPLAGFTDQENLGHDLFYGITSALNPTGKNARCAFCHADRPTPAPGAPGGTGGSDTGEEPFQLYSDDGYHNIGTPRNPDMLESAGDPDTGLAGHIGDDRRRGFFKTPTLRNVDKRKHKFFVKAYTHNGWFKSLESIVHFYNTAFLGNCVISDEEKCDGNLPAPPGAVGPPEIPYEATTAAQFGVTRCDGDMPERRALAANCWPAEAEPGSGIGFVFGDLRLSAEDEAAIVAYLKTLTDQYTPTPPPPYRATIKVKK